MIMLVVGMILATPALACPAGTSCTAENKLKAVDGYSEVTGMEKDEAILFASNLKDVKTLSNNQSIEALKQFSDYTKVYSLERKMEDGSTAHMKAVILPTELDINEDKELKSTYVVALWNDANTTNKDVRAMRYSSILKDGHLKELTFGRVDNNGKILEELLVSNGSAVENRTGEFTSDSLSPYWSCVIETISGDCLCLFLGDYCPPGLPSICDFCQPLFPACYEFPSQVTCGALAACLGIEILYAMYQCY
ncbi:MAG: hypothetical protein ACPK85_08530 [Methanosarcina sp.]